MRKLPILLFTAVFALSLALPAYAAESSNEELKAASQYLNSHGIMVGDGEGNMNFSAPLTRAHLATILARLHGGSGQVEESRDFYAAQCQFQDVPDWARQYAGYCAYHGLMVGYGDGLFGAEDPVTPAAACTVILRYLALPDLVWDYSSACSTACDLGLSEPAMTAQGTISRGDLAVMLYRALTGNFQGTSAGAAGASVSISSYKGNILKAGTRSGLLVYPSDAQLELVSSNPEILTVEQIAGNWVAVAKSTGTASIFVVTADGEQGRLTITVSDVDEGRLVEVPLYEFCVLIVVRPVEVLLVPLPVVLIDVDGRRVPVVLPEGVLMELDPVTPRRPLSMMLPFVVLVPRRPLLMVVVLPPLLPVDSMLSRPFDGVV